ncbi:MAG TPA: hypothetical protein PLV25_06195, partial [Opitutales bacterium]|nr:hypothetical protein [Opitutales bacterium]
NNNNNNNNDNMEQALRQAADEINALSVNHCRALSELGGIEHFLEILKEGYDDIQAITRAYQQWEKFLDTLPEPFDRYEHHLLYAMLIEASVQGTGNPYLVGELIKQTSSTFTYAADAFLKQNFNINIGLPDSTITNYKNCWLKNNLWLSSFCSKNERWSILHAAMHLSDKAKEFMKDQGLSDGRTSRNHPV